MDQQLQEIRKSEIEKGLITQFSTANSTGINTSTLATDANKKVFLRSTNYKTLRDFAIFYPVLRACINYRKRTISQLSWDIAPKEVILDPVKKAAAKKKAEEIKKMFKYPTGDKNVSFRAFTNKIIEDLIVLDATAIYKRKNRGGGMYGYLPIDASTIELILKEDGTTPPPPQEAYIQKIDGREVGRLTSEELIYRCMNPRTYTPYGLSPVESLILTITTALKLSAYNLGYLTEGNVPEGFVELPKDVASNADQLTLWQEKWDAMFSGDPRMQRKIKFLPEGMKLHETKKPGDMQYESFDKWLLLNTCSVMEVPPQAIGFQFDRGKGATEAEWEIGKERGLFPLANFLEEIFNEIVEEDLKEPDFQFIWTNINPTNKKEEAEVFKALVDTGAVSVDEWRISEGYDPIGLDHYIMSPIGPVRVSQFVTFSGIIGQQDQLAPVNPANPAKETEPAPKATTPTPDKTAKIEEKMRELTRGEVIEELKRWKKVAGKDMKQARDFRDFNSSIIDQRTQSIIKEGLGQVTTKEELDELFDPLISQENQVITAMIDLYDEITQLRSN